MGDRIVSSYYIGDNLIGQKYLERLKTTVKPTIIHLLKNDDNLSEDHLTSQKDGAPPDPLVLMCQFLSGSFPEQWIGRRVPIAWPVRSPDLSRLDFFYGDI
nr:unnamed protein product [Callosobruchus analis]